jgi:hypothetical protein
MWDMSFLSNYGNYDPSAMVISTSASGEEKSAPSNLDLPQERVEMTIGN